MTVRHMHTLAAKCSNVNALEALFVDQSKYEFDGPKPKWGELQRMWTQNVARITGGDSGTGEVSDGAFPF